MPNLLLEIGTEELPSSYIQPALDSLCASVKDLLHEAELGCAGVRKAATPRRLTMFAAAIADRQNDKETEIVGPPKRVAFADDGTPTKAGQGFAKKQGADVSEIYFKDTPKGPYCAVKKHITGRPAADILAEALPDIITGLPFPKSMRWRPGPVRFARPIRSMVALLDDAVIPFELAGVKTGRTTHGHPFLCPGEVDIAAADLDAYLELLKERFVIADFDVREQMIRDAVNAKLAAHGATLDDEDLLEDVVNLAEFPTVIEGGFDEKYLDIPAAVVVEAMREHQKYFAVYDSKRELQNKFLTVVNRDATHHDAIRAGNERVLEARLADAEFFWHEDCRTSLESKVERLKDVVFQDQLGSYFERAERIGTLVQQLGEAIGMDAQTIAHARRAARLAKADLVTLMVGEFAKLQGVMGKHYALHDGEPAEVADAIAEHYLPRYADDKLPQTDAGALVSLADKLDSIVGLFGIGLAPTGSQDPYALRRQATGVVRVIRARGLSLSLAKAVKAAQALIPESAHAKAENVDAVIPFLRDRLNQMALDDGRRYDIVNAVLAAGIDDINNAFARLETVSALAKTEQWPALVTIVERTFNISRNCDPDVQVDPALLAEAEEKKLWDIFERVRGPITTLIDAADYRAAALQYHDAFAAPVHDFFDRVFVNVDDVALRNNRLAMLRDIHALFAARIADLSQIVQAE